MSNENGHDEPGLHIHVWSDPDKETGEIDIIEEVDTDFFDFYRKDGEGPDKDDIEYFQFGATVQGKYLEIRLPADQLARLCRIAFDRVMGDQS